MSKKLKLLAVFLAAVMTLLSLPMSVFAEYFDDTPQVESIVCEKVTCIEKTGGYYYEGYYRYDYGYPSYTVVLKDGTILYSEYGRVEYNGYSDYISYFDDQYQDPWGVGVHTVEASLWGYETSFEVEIVKSPVVGVSVEPIKCIVGLDGYMDTDYNPDTDTYEEYFRYSSSPRSFTVTLNDGTELFGEHGWVYYNDQSYRFSVDDTQSFYNQWGIGVHKVEGEIMGFKTTFDVEIIESPIVSLEFESVQTIENANGYFLKDYDWETGTETEYYYYDINWLPLKWTAVMSDGSVLEGSGSLEYENEWYSFDFTTNQSCSSPWGLGVHTVEAEVMGFKTSFKVEIVETPVASIAFKPVKAIENIDGDMSDSWESPTGVYFRYYYNPELVVTMKDGTVIEGRGGIYYNDTWYGAETSDNQSYSNLWTVGNTYTAVGKLLGASSTIEVEIISCPIASIRVDPIVPMLKGADEDIWGLYNPETGEYEYYSRFIYNPNYTVTMNDGTEYTGNGSYFYYNNNGYEVEYTDDQSDSNVWDVGVHTVKMSLMGYETEFEIEIVSSPIVSLEFEPVQIIEGTNGYLAEEYDGETDTYKQYYRYDISPKWKAFLIDGRVIEGSGSADIEYNARWYPINFITDQSSSSPWGVGKYTVEASILGYTTSFDVEITPSPYVSIEVMLMTELRENVDCNKIGDGIVRYNHPRFFYKVTKNDGSSIVGYCTGYSFGELRVSDNQANEPWTVGGNNILTVEYKGLKTEVNVVINSTSPFDYTEQNGGVYITDCRVYNDAIEIPSQIDGKTVKGILSLGKAVENVRHIVIPDTVETIGADVFNYKYGVNGRADKLETLTVGGGMKYLNANMFKQCYALQSITVSADNENYCDIDGIVYNKAGDTLVVYPLGRGNNYTVPASVKDFSIINELPFYSSVNITLSDNSAEYKTVDGVTYNADMTKIIKCNPDKAGNYVMPETVTDIMPEAFKGCSLLTGVEFSNKVSGIVYRSFANCRALQSVKLPENLISIGVGAFENCVALNNVVLPNALEAIGEKAFYDCIGMSSVTFGTGLKTIDSRAFYDCPIESIVLHAGIEKIGDYAFSGAAIKTVTLPKGDINLGEGIFANCANIESFDWGDSAVIPTRTFENCGFRQLNIPSGIETIGDYAFYKCSQIESVNISDTVKEIKTCAFFSCESLPEIVLPDNVVTIGDSVFSNCSSLKSFTFGKSITKIPNGTFSSCGFETLVIPKQYTEIGDRAFSNCTSLPSIVLPDNVVTIGTGVFSGCSSLKSFTFGKSITKIPNSTFSSCGFETLVISEQYTEIGDGAFSYCRSLTSVTIENKNAVLGVGAFSNCALTEINLPVGFTSVSAYAFADNEIEELHLPDSVTKIAYAAFEDCSNLGEIELPEDLVSLGARSFDGTKWYRENADDIMYLSNALYRVIGNYDTFEVKDGTTVIADIAFYNAQLNSVVLPATLKGIGAGSFAYCGLTEINIPASVKYIGEFAFFGCDKLCAINVDPANEYYKSVDGVLFTKDGSELIWCPKRERANYIVPEGVKVIKSGAFASSGVENITVPDPETVLEEKAVGYTKGSFYLESWGVDWVTYSPTYVNIICRDGSAAMEYGEDNFVKITVVSGEISYCDHDTTVITRVEPTCTEAGSITETCALCGLVISTTELAATGHTAGEAVIVSPTCTRDGSKTVSCSVCGEIVSVESIPATGHDEELTVVVPTPIAQGYTEHKCKVCGFIYKDSYTDFEGDYSVLAVENATVKPGETVSVTVYAKNFNDLMNLYISNVKYDEATLSLISAEWLIDADEKQWGDGLGCIEFEENTAVDGAVLKLDFKALDSIEDCDTLVSVSGSYSWHEGDYTVESTFAESGGTISVRSSDIGDMNSDGCIDSDDAIYMLYYFADPARYPLYQPADFNGDGYVDSDDAIYLLYHTLLPERFPLLG